MDEGRKYFTLRFADAGPTILRRSLFEKCPVTQSYFIQSFLSGLLHFRLFIRSLLERQRKAVSFRRCSPYRERTNERVKAVSPTSSPYPPTQPFLHDVESDLFSDPPSYLSALQFLWLPYNFYGEGSYAPGCSGTNEMFVERFVAYIIIGCLLHFQP